MSYLRSGGGASDRLKSGGSGRLPSVNTDRTDKFTRLKAVLVGNLLKEYHRASKDSSHDEVVYQMALQEVDSILRRGKLTEQELKRLQHRFATEVPQRLGIKVERTDAQLAQTGPASKKPTGPSGLPPQPPPPRLNLENMSQTGANSSPNKLERPVDEWTVMILYNDVQHIEDERKKAEKIRAEKEKTRQMLLEQIHIREESRKGHKTEMNAFAQKNADDYAKWRADAQRSEEEKMAKVNGEREKLERQLRDAHEKKALERQMRLAEENRELALMAAEVEADKRAAEAQRNARNQNMQKVLIENKKELERKELMKQKEAEENARIQEIANQRMEKQEQDRKAAIDAVYAKQKKIAGNAQGFLEQRQREEAEFNYRVEMEQQRRQMEHEMKEREKNEMLKSKQRQTLESIKDQIHAKEEQKRLELEENKRIAEDYKRQAMEFDGSRRQEVVKDKAQKELQRRLFQEQIREKEQSRVMEFNMSETERRLNANLLRKVVEDNLSIVTGVAPPKSTRRPW